MNEAKDLIDRLGKVIGIKFKMHDQGNGTYSFNAIKKFNNIDYCFYINADRLLDRFYGIKSIKILDGKDESWLYEIALESMLDSAKDHAICLTYVGWPANSSPLLKLLDEDVVVLEKGICSIEQLKIWLDLHENS